METQYIHSIWSYHLELCEVRTARKNIPFSTSLALSTAFVRETPFFPDTLERVYASSRPPSISRRRFRRKNKKRIWHLKKINKTKGGSDPPIVSLTYFFYLHCWSPFRVMRGRYSSIDWILGILVIDMFWGKISPTVISCFACQLWSVWKACELI